MALRIIPPKPHAFVTTWLVGFTILIWLLQIVSGVDLWNPTPQQMLNWGANFAPITLGMREYDRLLINVFLHVGLIHLVVNMVSLLSLGYYAERYFGRLSFLTLYLLTGLCGSLSSATLSMLAASHSGISASGLAPAPAVSAGASGAIMGIAGALLWVAWRPEAGLLPQYRLNFQSFATVIVLNIGLGVVVSGIDNRAHLGGLISGFVGAGIWHITATLPRTTALILRSLSVLAALAALTAVLLWATPVSCTVWPICTH